MKFFQTLNAATIKKIKSRPAMDILSETPELVELMRTDMSIHYVLSLARRQEKIQDQFQRLAIDLSKIKQSEFTIYDPSEEEIQYLTEKGYHLLEHKYVMYIHPSSSNIIAEPLNGYSIQRVDVERCLKDDAVEMALLCFPQFYREKEDYTNFMSKWGGYEGQVFVGIFHINKLVGLGVLTISAHIGIKYGNLGFGAVHPNHQNRGLYRQLVKRRIEIAKNNNLEIITTYGLINTSGPILLHLGFEIAQTVATLVLNGQV